MVILSAKQLHQKNNRCSCRLLTHNKNTNTLWNMKVERLCIIKKDASNEDTDKIFIYVLIIRFS